MLYHLDSRIRRKWFLSIPICFTMPSCSNHMTSFESIPLRSIFELNFQSFQDISLRIVLVKVRRSTWCRQVVSYIFFNALSAPMFFDYFLQSSRYFVWKKKLRSFQFSKVVAVHVTQKNLLKSHHDLNAVIPRAYVRHTKKMVLSTLHDEFYISERNIWGEWT